MLAAWPAAGPRRPRLRRDRVLALALAVAAAASFAASSSRSSWHNDSLEEADSTSTAPLPPPRELPPPPAASLPAASRSAAAATAALQAAPGTLDSLRGEGQVASARLAQADERDGERPSARLHATTRRALGGSWEAVAAAPSPASPTPPPLPPHPPHAPPSVHSPLYQCSDDGSVFRDGAVVPTTMPCLWGEQGAAPRPLTVDDDNSTTINTCAGSELLAALGRGSLRRAAVEVVVVRHDEDISWSDEFARVRTVYSKPGPELSLLPATVPSSAAGEGRPVPREAATSPLDGLEVVLPNIGREQACWRPAHTHPLPSPHTLPLGASAPPCRCSYPPPPSRAVARVLYPHRAQLRQPRRLDRLPARQAADVRILPARRKHDGEPPGERSSPSSATRLSRPLVPLLTPHRPRPAPP